MNLSTGCAATVLRGVRWLSPEDDHRHVKEGKETEG
jgi:hypothetical protein